MKSACVASLPSVSKVTLRTLALRGVVFENHDNHRDLGLQFSAGRARAPALFKTRLATGTIRNTRIAKLALSNRKARKLFVSGTLPQSLWGQAVVGICSTDALRLGRLAASATGVNQTQRCLTSCYGSRGDPYMIAVKDTLRLWFKLIDEHER